MERRRFLAYAAPAVVFVVVDGVVRAMESCGPPKPAAPQRRTGGESFPPLPLPATPLRRTEKKRQPRPPTLIAKTAYGPEAALVGGKQVQWPDWKTDPGDVETLLSWVNGQLQINYGSIETSFKTFSYDVAEVPVLYLTGHKAPSVDDRAAGRLRAFLQDGGTLIADACCGSPEYRRGFEALVPKVFPDRPLRRLPHEHPLFTCFADCTNVAYSNVADGAGGRPLVKGVDIGCRTAVFYFPRDVSCGWAGHEHPEGERCKVDDARRLGANLVTYILASYSLGRHLASAKIYYESDVKSRDEFVFGQLVHEGDWDPSPSGIATLLEHIDRNTTINVQYKKVPVAPESAEVFNFPLLYMAGHYNFVLSEAAVENLRRFLSNGGVLFAESCCGRAEFDKAFRREMGRVLPESQLRRIPFTSPVYSSFQAIRRVGYSPYARATLGDVDAPLLEGLTYDGELAVIYSPLAVANGWEGFDHPYSKGYEAPSALALGTNILVYVMSH